MSNFARHPFHLVDESPWPILARVARFNVFIRILGFFLFGKSLFLGICVFILAVLMFRWWGDISVEATYQGFHLRVIELGLRWAVVLFIAREVLFFASFFWRYFHASLAPEIVLGGVWPPKGVVAMDPLEIPLLNTVVLLSSGVTVTWTHKAVLTDDFFGTLVSLGGTIFLGIYFLGLQAIEYVECSFTLRDGTFGRTFFILTGFHGLHVLVGATFLGVSWLRLWGYNYSTDHHVGLEASIWYWHFVDVVWLFLYIFVYCWRQIFQDNIINMIYLQ